MKRIDGKKDCASGRKINAALCERFVGALLVACYAVGGGAMVVSAKGLIPATGVGAETTRPMSELKVAARIPIAKTTDWVKITTNSVWVGSKEPFAVNEIDPSTNRVIRVLLPGDPCAGLAADADSLWVPLCGPSPKLAKVDLKTRTLKAVFNVGPAGPEGGIAAGAGSVWMMTDKLGSLARIDPISGAIIGRVQLPAGSYNPVFSDNRLWVSRADGAELTIVDIKTAKVVGHIATGPGPRFLTTGAGAIWTLNQGDGSLSRIDIAGRRPVETLPLNTPGPGGDITYADGRVWTTMLKTPLTVIDGARTVVLCQWKGTGGDAIGVGFGSVWLTDLKTGSVLRLSLRDFPQKCLAAASAEQ